jgi:succinate-semialdehyde dehydrogenase/glutarate-semialdehyde dehydrogenase
MGDAHIEYEPLGVLLSVQPWNYPYYQLSRFAAPHLASGNTMLVKHAPDVPQCALAFERILQEAALPEGVYTNVFISNEQADKVIEDPRIQGVALTGSERTGSILASLAGQNLKKSTMELGGSDAFIVLEDCDLDFAVKMAVVGRIGNVGQTCIGAKRFIVVGPRVDRFLEAFSAALALLNPGDPFDPQTTLGPLCSEGALEHLLSQVKEAVSYGAHVYTGGNRIDRPGAFMQPTILTNITPDNPAYRQEFFGPVALFFKARNEEEAVAIANDSPYGLGGSI